MMISQTPEPDYDSDYHYELIGGPMCGRNAEILGRSLMVATSINTHGHYIPNHNTGTAIWTEGDPGAAPATTTRT